MNVRRPSMDGRFAFMNLGDRLPSFEGVEWLDGIAPALRAGAPALVHFWSTGCPLCHEGAGDVSTWRAKHGPDVLDVIAVYAMRPDATTIDVDSARRDARSIMRIAWPCAIDRERTLERVFSCPYSPGYFIFDAGGVLRHRQMGNDRLDRIAELLDRFVVKASSASEA
jgi:thiol-disulfide isomerase/thioredoxin